MTTTAPDTDIQWPTWQDPAFYNQDITVMSASIAAQRRAAPVHWYEPEGYPRGFWVLTKWDDQRFVASHPELFSSEYGYAIGDASDPSTILHTLPDWARDALSEPGLSFAQTRRVIAKAKASMGDPNLENTMQTDPPRHGEIRSVLMTALRPSLVRSLKPRIAEIADELLDELEPDTDVDFVTTVGRIPAALMTELIGVPRDMRERFIEMASAQIAALTIDPDRDPAEIERIGRLVDELHGYCEELLADRRARGGAEDDLVSIIARSKLDGGPVPLGLAISHIHTFVLAGETQRSHLSFAAMALAQHPDQRRLLVEQPELVSNAMEESLRYYPLNWSGCRTATQRVEIGGQVIDEDDFVMMAYVSANRDDEVWPGPDEFDVTRSFEKDHLGFGYGEHACPGALLARSQSTIIFERLLARFPDWDLTAPPQKWATAFLEGMTSLPLTFHR
jgi:cytochrome P450